MTAAQPARIRFHAKYKPLLKGLVKTRYLLITGGRGSGKSFAVASWACINSTEPAYKQRTLYTRYTLTAAQISIIPEFEEKLDMLGVRSRFDVTAREITCRATGSDIIFSGIKTSSGNQTARLKSIPGLNIFIIEEGEEFVSESDFDIIDLSIRNQDAPNLVVIVMNPPTSEHWVWGRWLENSHRMEIIGGVQVPISTHPDITHIHTTYLDNRRNLPESYLKQIAKIKAGNPDKYAHQIIGAWRARAVGAIFENWAEGEFDFSLPGAYGLDFGYFPDPTALVQIAIDNKRKRIYLRELLYSDKLSTEQIISAVSSRLDNPRAMVVADSAEKRTIADMAKARINVVPAAKGPDSVRAGLVKMQGYELVVTPESANLKKELNNYIWNDKKSTTPVDDYNHLIDAARYAFMRLTSPTGLPRML